MQNKCINKTNKVSLCSLIILMKIWSTVSNFLAVMSNKDSVVHNIILHVR